MKIGLDRPPGSRYILRVLNAFATLRTELRQGADRIVLSTETAGERTGVQADFAPDDPYFSGLRRSFGASSVALGFGPLQMVLDGLSERQADDLARRFRPFVVESAARPDVHVVLHPAGVDRFLRMRRDGSRETYRLESRRTGERLVLWSYEFAGRLDPSEGRATLALVEERGAQFDRGLENFLRVLTAFYILERGGLLLHASAVVRDGAAHLFFGPSGRGKTTVTHLSPEDVVLSDDLSLLVRNGDGFEAAGIPFGMAHHRVPDSRDSFPIASLNSLVQSLEVKREPLTGARALAELSASLPFVMQERRQSGLALEVLERLLATVPAYRLWFRKDPSFWTVVEEAAR
jgi:hypothetical protein